jgi:hypothetical protein
MKIFLIVASSLVLAVSSSSAQQKKPTEMTIGPAWMHTIGDYFDGKPRVGALKGVSVDLGEEWRALYDTETLRLVTVYKGAINWGGTPWTGKHGSLVRFENQAPLVITATGSGWVDADGSFDDKRAVPGHGDIAHGEFSGHYRHGNHVILEYTVHGTLILECLMREGDSVTRSMQFGARDKELALVIADEKEAFEISADGSTAKSKTGLQVTAMDGMKLVADTKQTGRLLAKVATGKDPLTARIAFSRAMEPKAVEKPDFAKLIKGSPAMWTETVTTKGQVSTDQKNTYVTDAVVLPENNPWFSNMRFGGFDFIDEDSAALSTWNGDVWVVRGLKGDWSELKWQRIAAGLFETLGLAVVKGEIYVNGRDQITKLVDLNGDGETDYFKVFNRDVYITSNFHEFAFDLTTDKEGNFYFSKGGPVRGGGRGFDPIIPHHGIVAKISPDGRKFEVIATGLRAPGGVGVGPNGEISTGENEGTWQPCCKINFFNIKNAPVFLGTEPTRHDLKDAPFNKPLVYLPMDVDNSGASQVWVPNHAKMGLKPGEMLHLSYGAASIYRVLPVADAGGKVHGGVAKLPVTLMSSAMRARFHRDGSMYVLGFRGWQTKAATPAAFQRVRYNETAGLKIPEKLEYTAKGVKLTFPVALDDEVAEDPTSYSVQRWNYVRGPQYGSGEFSVDKPDTAALEKALTAESHKQKIRDTVGVLSAKLSSDKKTVDLEIDGMKPSMSLKVSYDLEDKDGTIMKSDIHATVHEN